MFFFFCVLNIGQSICMGGYENNPILLDKVPSDFQFGLYDLDYSVFDTHIEGAVKLCPTFGNAGIKSTICGPESFTPDHKPLMVCCTTISIKTKRERKFFFDFLFI